MKVNVSLLQSRDYGSKAANLAHTLELIAAAAAGGAQVICTQELFLTDYFCRTQDTDKFALAETVPGATVQALCEAARQHGVVLIASLFEEQMKGLYYNTSVVIDADGSYLGKYRKSHIPQDPSFEEKFYFAPGDTGIKVWDTRFGRLGLVICWDQWYPESARLAALAGAEIIFAPTAIGWLPEEKERLGAQQHRAWETVQRGHAVANCCYWAAVNRVGVEPPSEFWGQSFIADYFGDIVARGSTDREELVSATVDLEAIRAHRQIWPFFRDRRIDMYQPLLKRSISPES